MSNISPLPSSNNPGSGDLGRGPLDVLIKGKDVDWTWGSSPDPRPLFTPNNTTAITFQGTLIRKWDSPVHVTGGSVRGTDAASIVVTLTDATTGSQIPAPTSLNPDTGNWEWSVDAQVTAVSWDAQTSMTITGVTVSGDLLSLAFSNPEQGCVIHTSEPIVYKSWLNAPVDLLGVFVNGDRRDVIRVEGTNGQGQYLTTYDHVTGDPDINPISSNLATISKTATSWAVVDGSTIGGTSSPKLLTLTRLTLWIDASGGTPWPSLDVHLISDDGNGGWIDHGTFGSTIDVTSFTTPSVVEITGSMNIPSSARLALVFSGGGTGITYSVALSTRTPDASTPWFAEGGNLGSLTRDTGSSHINLLSFKAFINDLVAQGPPKSTFQPVIIILEPRHPTKNIVEPRYIDQHYVVDVTDITNAAIVDYEYRLNQQGSLIRIDRDAIFDTAIMSNGFSFSVDVVPQTDGLLARHEGIWDLLINADGTLKLTGYDDDGTSTLAKQTTEAIPLDGTTKTRIIAIIDTQGSSGVASIYINGTAATLTDAGSSGTLTTLPASNGSALFIGGSTDTVTGFKGSVFRVRYHLDYVFTSSDISDINSEDTPRAICAVRVVPNPNYIDPMINVPGANDTIHGSLEGGWPPATEIHFINDLGSTSTGHAVYIVPDGSVASFYAQASADLESWAPHCANNDIDGSRCLAGDPRWRTSMCREDCPNFTRPTSPWNPIQASPGDTLTVWVRVQGSAPGVQGSNLKIRIALKH